jgi:hypothetical protein
VGGWRRGLEFSAARGTTDPTIVKAILRVQDREGYWWVECAACDHGWQVAYFAAESAR